MKTVFVTGGAGFIGSHTCVVLLEKGYKLYVLDSYINSSRKSLNKVKKIVDQKDSSLSKNLNIIEGDIRDENTVEDIFREAKNSGSQIDGVIHFAGLKSVEESINYPQKYWDTNVNGSITLLKVMDNNNCRKIVFSSSATIYGLVNDLLIKEDFKIQPINPYGTTKAAVEQLLNDIFKSNKEKWKIANLRYFNPIGAHPSGLIGENPLGTPNNLFPFITQVATKRIKELKIFGKDWPTIDGTGVRDYIHIMDLAEGHLKAYEHLSKKTSTLININLGTGQGTSVLELIKTFEEVNKIKIPFKYGSRRDGDAAKMVADTSLALSTLNWATKRNIEDMCRDGWNWQFKNPKGY